MRKVILLPSIDLDRESQDRDKERYVRVGNRLVKSSSVNHCAACLPCLPACMHPPQQSVTFGPGRDPLHPFLRSSECPFPFPEPQITQIGSIFKQFVDFIVACLHVRLMSVREIIHEHTFQFTDDGDDAETRAL
jgi:hypothetical protein